MKNVLGFLMFGLGAAAGGAGAQAPVTIQIDVAQNRHPISPLIYGVAFADGPSLKALNSPLNRFGGNSTTGYNWKQNVWNLGNDWFFQSIREKSEVPAEKVDTFVAATKAGNASPLITIPMIEWVGKTVPGTDKLASYSVKKYGAQQKTDQWMPDSGNGVKPDGTKITGNDPNDANTPNSPEFQKEFIEHLKGKWGAAKAGGVKYYILDNEPALWNSTHRDEHPLGLTMEQLRDKMLAFGSMIKVAEPGAVVLGPEEWGWTGYIYSAADTDYATVHGWGGPFPDRTAHGNMDIMPWLLDQFRRNQETTGKRLLDVFTLHMYPQGGDSSDDVSEKMQLLRNRSTRGLWDPEYKDESWINEKIALLPRMKKWVNTYYPGTKIGLTEYSWGASDHINGATAQADILGIFGREGLDLATRWIVPKVDTPAFRAMQMYRNYDGKNGTFGDVSVSCLAPNPDEVSAFAAVRAADKALTVMVINKVITPVSAHLALSNTTAGNAALIWQLTAANTITRLADVPTKAGGLDVTLPAQSVTLFVVTGK